MEQYELDLNTSLYNQYGEKYCEKRISGGTLFNDYIESPVVRMLLGDPTKLHGKRALDIGCGPGIYTKMLLMAGTKITALDSSELMLNATREYCATSSGSNDVDFVQSRFETVELGKIKYDLILATFMLSYFEDLTNAFLKMKAHLNKGGVIISSMLHPIRLFSKGRDKEHYIFSNYFEEGFYNADFLDESASLRLRKYNFQDIHRAADSAGLKVNKLFEPKASLNCGYPDLEKLDFYSKNPSVLVLCLSSK